MKKINEEKELGFITQGIYNQIPLQNNCYKINDCVPIIVDNKPKIIGEGRFSEVYLYKNKYNDSLFALKKISINKILESGNNLNIIQREIDIHSKIKHENIVQFYSVNKEINEVNILLEYCNNGSIYELISKDGFDEYKAYLYFCQVVNAIYFLHKNNLVHRDIKPENILLSYDKIKLCDFGWCCQTSENNRKSFCGTFEYMAPEILKDLPYGKPVDIWALGILLYEFYYGVSPFSSNKEKDEQSKEIINNIICNKLSFPNRKEIPYDMKDLIIHMLEMDVSKRYTIEQVAGHPWFKKCRKEIQNKEIKNHIPIIKSSKMKITKITNMKNRILFNSYINHPTEKNYDYNDNFEFSNKSKSKNKVIKLVNIDINVEEDNSSPIKDHTSNNINLIDNNINVIKVNPKNNNNDNQDIYENSRNQKDNIYSQILRYKSNKDNNNNNSQEILDDENNSIFFPMDSILEGTSNEEKEEANSLFQKHASVIKLNSNNIISKFNNRSQNLKNNITNNYFLNNNFYTINYYSEKKSNEKNNNDNLPYFFPFPNFPSNEI